jgi:hypothetical protein
VNAKLCKRLWLSDNARTLYCEALLKVCEK